MTLKELADIGAVAAFADNRRYHYMSVSRQSHSWESDEPARQAFAQAVRDAVLAELVTKPDSSPTWKLPDPPKGREWHRTDWTEEMLPDGYRPLLLDEVLQEESDSFLVNSYPLEFEIVKGLAGDTAHQRDQHRRTTRPLPPVTKTVLLDINDIRATDEFRHKESSTFRACQECSQVGVYLSGAGTVNWTTLATNYLRRQHGSTEWKPCTKEVEV